MAQEGTSPDSASKTIVAAVVLAAGLGARFGQPKYSATLRGQRIVDRAIELVRPFCRDVVERVAAM